MGAPCRGLVSFRALGRPLVPTPVPATDVIAGARPLDAIPDLAEAGVHTAVIDHADPGTVEAAPSADDTSVLVSGNDHRGPLVRSGRGGRAASPAAEPT